MSAKDYSKADAIAFGEAVGNLVNAVKKDGVGTDDFDELIAMVTTSAKAMNEMKDVPGAAALHIIGAASETVGDEFLAEAIAAEETP